MAATAKIFKSGNSQAVRLPRAHRLPGREAAIRRDGDKIILEPIAREHWPRNFFNSIRIGDPSFARPPQGGLPPPVDLGV